MRIRGKLLAGGVTVLALAGAAGCTGGNDQAASTQELTPAQRLAAAKSRLDAAPSVHLKLTSAEVPAGASGVVSADGWGKHPPAFKGTFKVSLKGVQADAEVTSVDGGVWAKLPLVPGINKIDPKAFGIPDPAVLFSPDKGLTNLLTATTAPALGGQTRKGSEVLTSVTGKVPGSAVVDLFLIGDRNGTFDATYSLTDKQELREVTLAGPFFGTGSKSYYILVLDQYGQPVTITQPVG
jgi:lipoprotein LprG